MYCPICIKDQPHLFIQKSCSCKFCYQCALNWIEELIKQKQNIKSFKCLNYQCKEEISLMKFHQSIVSKKIENRFQEIMFKNYLQRTQDVRPCPNKACNNYCFLPKSRCKEEFVCDQCNFVWVDKQYLPYNKLLFINFNQVKNNIFSIVFKFFKTQNCPKCNVQIMKNGGCRHMTCKKCLVNFCWYCKNYLEGHDDDVCSKSIISYYLLILYNTLITLYLVGFHLYLILLMYPLYLFAIVIIYNLYVFIPFILIATITGAILRFKIEIKNRKKYVMDCIYGLLIEGLIYLIVFIGIELLEVSNQQLMNYHYYQGIIIGICGTMKLIHYGLNKLIFKIGFNI
ncbi:unnamed protein product [Paramecium sonneborni]|uniref:RING-type domain-containing protein n=1 Tax=Paramecium sonneborni TaxID=65129 RepID=A0A8S1RGL9_9CILI|nr:unnamed protein product [Paramecium sonneborni]